MKGMHPERETIILTTVVVARTVHPAVYARPRYDGERTWN